MKNSKITPADIYKEAGELFAKLMNNEISVEDARKENKRLNKILTQLEKEVAEMRKKMNSRPGAQ